MYTPLWAIISQIADFPSSSLSLRPSPPPSLLTHPFTAYLGRCGLGYGGLQVVASATQLTYTEAANACQQRNATLVPAGLDDFTRNTVYWRCLIKFARTIEPFSSNMNNIDLWTASCNASHCGVIAISGSNSTADAFTYTDGLRQTRFHHFTICQHGGCANGFGCLTSRANDVVLSWCAFLEVYTFQGMHFHGLVETVRHSEVKTPLCWSHISVC